MPRWLRGDDVTDVGSFRRQLVVLTGIVAMLVAIALVVIVQVVLAGTASEAVRRVLQDRADAVTSATSGTPEKGLNVPEARLGPGVAVYDRAGRLVAGETPPSLGKVFNRLSGSTRTATSQAADDYELLARPFTTSSGTRGVVVVAEPLAPYENDERDALVVSLVAGVVIVTLAVALTAWTSRRALAPVAQMARTAEQWSDRDLDRRFALGEPTNEIRALGHTLDGLLDRVAHAILAEQRLTSELAHELRTPLTAIQATAQLTAMRDDLDEQLDEDLTDILASCQSMSTTITALLDLARAQSTTAAGRTCDLHDVIDTIRQGALTRPGATGTDISTEMPQVLVAAPAELVRRCVGPVVDNATRVAHHVRLSIVIDARVVHVFVADDGPGIPIDMAGRLFEPGHTTGDGGSGLGLALARRVARSIGGDVELVNQSTSTAPTNGAVFTITLPLA